MTTFDDLRNAIDSLLSLPSVHSPLRLNSSTCERAYEVYVLGLCVEAVRRAGGIDPIPTGIRTGSRPSEMVFRGAPGDMWCRTQDFCYMDCTIGSKHFEIHVDVEYEGSSGATHEIDISICEKKYCEKVRSSIAKILPKNSKSIIVILECKFYDNSTPKVSLARTFVGLLNDFNKPRLAGFISNVTTPGLKNYLAKDPRPKPFHPQPFDRNSEEAFIEHVKHVLERWAKI